MSDKSQCVNLEKGFMRHLHKERVDYIVKKIADIKKSIRRPVRILDIGCGDGVVTKHLRLAYTEGDKVFALDNSAVRIERARQCCPEIDLRCGEAEKLDFDDQNFDIVFLHHVIEHVSDDKKVLGECKRVLKSDGYLILGFPNEGGIIGRILQRLHRNLYKKSDHVRFYSIRSMGDFLEEEGFIVGEYAKFGLLFPFYYIHILFLMNKFTFKLGNILAGRFDFLADSVIFVVKKRRADAFF